MNPFALSAAEIQKAIDQQIAARGWSRYVEWVRYVPQGQPDPVGMTQRLALVCPANVAAGLNGEIVIAAKARALYALLPLMIPHAELQAAIDALVARVHGDRYLDFAIHVTDSEPAGVTQRLTLTTYAPIVGQSEITIALGVKQPFANMANTFANVY